MTAPKVSVVVCVYNKQTTLMATLRSIAAQTLTELECIVVDDGSTDQSGALIDRFCASDPRFRALHTPNQGVSRARQLGLSQARAEYVIHADADDEADPLWLQHLEAEAERAGADIVSCDYFLMKAGHELMLMPQRPSAYDAASISISLALHKLHGVLWNRLVRRQLAQSESFRPATLTVSEDLLYLLRLLQHEPRLAHVAKPLYSYRVGQTASLVNDINEAHIESHLTFCRELALMGMPPAVLWHNKRIALGLLVQAGRYERLPETFPEVHAKALRHALFLWEHRSLSIALGLLRLPRLAALCEPFCTFTYHQCQRILRHIRRS